MEVIVFNAGSSSIKFTIFSKDLNKLFYGEIENIFEKAKITIKDINHKTIYAKKISFSLYDDAIDFLFNIIKKEFKNIKIKAAGHRITHGGDFKNPVFINKNVIKKLKKFIPICPLHQKYNIALVEKSFDFFKNIKQIACFDTSFHQTQKNIAKMFALPKNFTKKGIIKYGFHGISYQYILSQLNNPTKQKKIIIAHLGSGSSMCAIQDSKSIATTMSFTPLDGLMMGTRCGSIDPGVILYLMEEKNISELRELLYKKSGLKGVSNISSDMRKLLKSNTKSAKEAIELYCYQASKQLGSLLPTIYGLDVLIFTGGIGENCPLIRKMICEKFLWLGLRLDEKANQLNDQKISLKTSNVDVYVIPTDEEKFIAQQTLNLLSLQSKD